MYIYRPHRGGLDESMELKQEFATKEEMFRQIAEDNKILGTGIPMFDISDLVIDEESATDDKRTGWHNTMYVCVKRYGDEDYMKLYGTPQCIGMCATDYDGGVKTCSKL